ncbi:MAG: lipid-A-disaccharide synthase, partial [Cyanobacteria bacterium]|nr:lipid-A-disaccharide synthase [Cyanobacteriota bacterium]
ADVALTKSGTVNLEMALMQVPQVVTYRVNPITARLAYYLLKFKVSFVSPVNLALGEALVPEFIQWQATPTALATATVALLAGPQREQMLAGYGRLRQALGEPGVCDRVAQALLRQAQPETGAIAP